MIDHYAFGDKDVRLVNASYRDTTAMFKKRKLDAVSARMRPCGACASDRS